jgi:hypothetical protein
VVLIGVNVNDSDTAVEIFLSLFTAGPFRIAFTLAVNEAFVSASLYDAADPLPNDFVAALKSEALLAAPDADPVIELTPPTLNSPLSAIVAHAAPFADPKATPVPVVSEILVAYPPVFTDPVRSMIPVVAPDTGSVEMVAALVPAAEAKPPAVFD